MVTTKGLGYLSPEEVDLANAIISERHASLRIPPSIVAYSELLAILALFLVAGTIHAHRLWQLHETLVAEQVELQKQLPRKISPQITFRDVRVYNFQHLILQICLLMREVCSI
jgi:hypothetical protein